MTGQPHFDSSIISHPTSRPSYGAGATVESGAYGDEYYEEDEDSWELEEEIAKLEENYGCKFYSSRTCYAWIAERGSFHPTLLSSLISKQHIRGRHYRTLPSPVSICLITHGCDWTVIADDGDYEEEMGGVWPSDVPNRLGESGASTGTKTVTDVSLRIFLHSVYIAIWLGLT